MGYLLQSVLSAIVALSILAIVRTLVIKAPAPGVCDTEISQSELDTAAVKLGAMVRVPCVSKGEDEDLTEFYNYHAVLEQHFPLLHASLEKEVLNGTLLYRWKGADSAKKPIMLMGHQDVVPASDEGW